MEIFGPEDALMDVEEELARCESLTATEEDRLHIMGRWTLIELSCQRRDAAGTFFWTRGAQGRGSRSGFRCTLH
jgi:hypothetical protein